MASVESENCSFIAWQPRVDHSFLETLTVTHYLKRITALKRRRFNENGGYVKTRDNSHHTSEAAMIQPAASPPQRVHA